ncbi:MAG: Kelch repeat-containing protein [Brevinemataceae bacterium]
MTWKKMPFEAPFEERTGHGMVNIGRKLILFGGRNPKTGKYLNDVWLRTILTFNHKYFILKYL